MEDKLGKILISSMLTEPMPRQRTSIPYDQNGECDQYLILFPFTPAEPGICTGVLFTCFSPLFYQTGIVAFIPLEKNALPLFFFFINKNCPFIPLEWFVCTSFIVSFQDKCTFENLPFHCSWVISYSLCWLLLPSHLLPLLNKSVALIWPSRLTGR